VSPARNWSQVWSQATGLPPKNYHDIDPRLGDRRQKPDVVRLLRRLRRHRPSRDVHAGGRSSDERPRPQRAGVNVIKSSTSPWRGDVV
jgi:hypothetical protein